MRFIYRNPVHKYFFVPSFWKLENITDEDVLSMAYRLIYVTDGTSKQTASGRFTSLDIKTKDYLNKTEVNKIHDVGVSSGITSMELLNFLNDNHLTLNFYISDKYSTVYGYKSCYGLISRFYDADGKLMISYLGPFVATNKDNRRILSKLLYNLLKKYL